MLQCCSEQLPPESGLLAGFHFSAWRFLVRSLFSRESHQYSQHGWSLCPPGVFPATRPLSHCRSPPAVTCPDPCLDPTVHSWPLGFVQTSIHHLDSHPPCLPPFKPTSMAQLTFFLLVSGLNCLPHSFLIFASSVIRS